jgi:hypothetical protein
MALSSRSRCLLSKLGMVPVRCVVVEVCVVPVYGSPLHVQLGLLTGFTVARVSLHHLRVQRPSKRPSSTFWVLAHADIQIVLYPSRKLHVSF